MISIHTFTFNPFQENTYILSDETGECLIIDPGCYGNSEEQKLISFIKEKKFRPVKLLNTHCHIDHVFGNLFISEAFGLAPWIHREDLIVLESLPQVASMYGFSTPASPAPAGYIKEGERITFGNSELEIFFTPGHSPGSVIFYSPAQKFIIGGDVLFFESIGRTDLPGGNHETLLQSIRSKIFVLPDHVKVYPGHGQPTTVGHEKQFNPFL